MSELITLKNIGTKTAAWLQEIGIEREEDLVRMGVVETYLRLQMAYPEQVSLNALWALQGALLGLPWNQIPKEIKAELLEELRVRRGGFG